MANPEQQSNDSNVPKVTEELLAKIAIDSALPAEDVATIETSTLGFLGVAAATARFSESNGQSIIRKNIEVTVPSGTRRIMVYLGDWDFSFGRTNYIQRPLSHMLVKYGINSFSGRLATLNVRALLRDINADDAWEANIELVVACFG